MGNTSSRAGRDDMKTAVELSLSVATFLSAAYFFYTVSDSLAVFSSKQDNCDREKQELARKLKRPELASLEYSKHELNIALDVICPDDLTTSFDDVGGMTKEIDVLMDNVILPFKFWKEECDRVAEQRASANSNGEQNPVENESNVECHVPGGLLMYGRPGTGKSMLAKAIAKEADASFIGVKSGTVLDKYVGESDKLVTAIFTLAQKIAPTVIFIDEVDTLLKKRESLHSGSASSIGSMLGTLMSEWDGINSDGKAPVIVLGATNRPMDIDDAFLRRMPLTIQTQAPNYLARIDIFTKMLQSEVLSDDVNLEMIAASTDGYTGSDIREICRLASIQRMKAILKSKKELSKATDGVNNNTQHVGGGKRALMQADFENAISKSLQDGEEKEKYSEELGMEDISSSDFAKKFIRMAMSRSHNNPNVGDSSGGH